MGRHDWQTRAAQFVTQMYDASAGAYRAAPAGSVSLYGTCYGLLTRLYLGHTDPPAPATLDFIQGCQDVASGYFVGPELKDWTPPPQAVHDREHLLLHLTCATLPVLQQFGAAPRAPLPCAHAFLDPVHLRQWLDARDLTNPWLEGNNLLFIGQLLVYLRDVEKNPRAQPALDLWFAWLDRHVDPATGLWGSDRGASVFAAMCGGYHQLLIYYYEDHPVQARERLIDAVLDLQHADGGFGQEPGGGACEDVDALDILVNMYKQIDYRRVDVRMALRRCVRLILSIQNDDGGFPYHRAKEFRHMGIPATYTPKGASSMFATWFRTHTLMLAAEILTDERPLARGGRFNTALSMGWHRTWDRRVHGVRPREQLAEMQINGRRWLNRSRLRRRILARTPVLWKFVQ